MKQGIFGLTALTAIALTLALQPVAIAEPQQLEKLKDPFIVEIRTPLDGAANKPGDPFEAVLRDELVYENTKTLPEGTRFLGHVENTRISKRFGRRGYIVLNVDKAIFPDGTEVEFLVGDYESREKKAWDEKTFRRKQKDKKLWYIKAPLSAASFVAPFPIGLAVRGGAGLIVGLTDKDTKHEPVVKRVGKGLYNVTPIPTVVNFVRKHPTPSYQPGDRIYLYMPEEALAKMLEGDVEPEVESKAESKAESEAQMQQLEPKQEESAMQNLPSEY